MDGKQHFVAAAITLILLVLAVSRGNADEAATFHGKIVLLGAVKHDEPLVPLIQTIKPDGTNPETLVEPGLHVWDGRVSPDGKRLAYTTSEDNGRTMTCWIVGTSGKPEKVADPGGAITAWSSDGKQLSYYRHAEGSAPKSQTWESFVFDLGTKKEQKLVMPADYVIDDWHPKDRNMHTAMYQNRRNMIYRKEQQDAYPTRQLDLWFPESDSIPLSRDPSFDNIWSRFSPSGNRIAHYRRRFINGRPMEFVAVCTRDPIESREVFSFMEMADRQKWYEFRPHGYPCWSPDEKTIAWLVTTRQKEGDEMSLELVFIPVDGGELQRWSLTELGYRGVQAIEWK